VGTGGAWEDEMTFEERGPTMFARFLASAFAASAFAASVVAGLAGLAGGLAPPRATPEPPVAAAEPLACKVCKGSGMLTQYDVTCDDDGQQQTTTIHCPACRGSGKAKAACPCGGDCPADCPCGCRGVK
jgi:hypothetical protein